MELAINKLIIAVGELMINLFMLVSYLIVNLKMSPSSMTGNHKNTKKGTVKGGFDRKNLFQQAEQGFDRIFNHKRQLSESFEYYNAMKNGSISDQLNMQERQISDEGKNKGIQAEPTENMVVYKQDNSMTEMQTVNQENKKENDQSFKFSDMSLSSALGLLTPDITSREEEQQIPVKKKKKKPKKGIRRS